MTSPRARAASCSVRFRPRRRGGTLLETAIVLPMLLLVLTGIIQFGSILFLRSSMLNAARDAARRLAVGELTVQGAEEFVADRVSSWPHGFTIDAQAPDGSDPNDRDVRVAVSVPLADAAIIPIPGMSSAGDMRAEVVMRLE
jgi:hypothetical protein